MEALLRPEQVRKSEMQLNTVYFWTNTIKDWKNLLKQDKYKLLIIDSLKWLCERNLIAVYAFVIMPNHIHLDWEMLKQNGKESPNASFNKFRAHAIVDDLKKNHPAVLPYFEENERERRYRIWQRDPLAVYLENPAVMEQKLNYIHNNPLQHKWNLASAPEQYQWSSAGFYYKGKDDFGLLTHVKDRFG